MQLVIEIPDQFSEMAEPSEWAKQFKLNTALLMYKKAAFTLGQASHFCGLDKYTFMQECGKNEIEVIQYEPGELESELAFLRKLIP